MSRFGPNTATEPIPPRVRPLPSQPSLSIDSSCRRRRRRQPRRPRPQDAAFAGPVGGSCLRWPRLPAAPSFPASTSLRPLGSVLAVSSDVLAGNEALTTATQVLLPSSSSSSSSSRLGYRRKLATLTPSFSLCSTRVSGAHGRRMRHVFVGNFDTRHSAGSTSSQVRSAPPPWMFFLCSDAPPI